MALTPTQTLVQILNRYCFRDIWNATQAEYRVNVALTPVSSRYLRGTLRVGFDHIALPTSSTQYLAFSTALPAFNGGLRLPTRTWVTGLQLLTDTDTLLYLYTAIGRLIPRQHIHLYKSQHSERVFVAVPKAVIRKVFGDSYGTVYLTPYRDSDQVNEISCRSWWIDPANLASSASGLATYFTAAKAANLAGTTVLINGEEVDETQAAVPFSAGDYVEIVLDRNVVGAYDVDVSAGQTGYTSTRHNELREILHCPKALNPNNYLITHNTCTLSVRRTLTHTGRYLHRTDDTAAGQLTHNDLSVDSNVIDAFRAHLEDQDVYIRVRVRTHSKTNALISELFYITLLYHNDDATILQHLKGDADPTLSFWTAEALEDSLYLQLMFDTPNSLDEQLLTTYVEGLGYHTVATILGAHVAHAQLQGTLRYFTVAKAPALVGRSVRPLAYLRGVKLRDSQYTYVDTRDRVQIRLDDNLVLQGDDAVAAVLVEHGPAQPYLFTPTEGDTAITVPFGDAVVYRQISLDTPVVGRMGSASVAYEPLAYQAGTLVKTVLEDGDLQIVAGVSLYGETLLVWNAQYSHAVTHEITTAVNDTKGALILPLQMAVFNDEELVVPTLGTPTIEIYLNGRKLLENLDYTIRPYVDADDHVALCELVLSALDNLATDGSANYVEVVTHTGAAIDAEAGYTYEGKISFDTSINIWTTGLSRGYVRGLLLAEPAPQGHWIDPGTGADASGEPYQLVTMLPGSVAAALSGYDQTPNLNRLTAIRNYFHGQLTADRDFILIENGYTVHSPYLAQIIRDVIEGDLTIVNDPSDALFLAQFTAYDDLKQRDPVLVNPTAQLDRTYVDVLATYVPDWVVDEPLLFTMINRLVALTLPNDPNALGSIN